MKLVKINVHQAYIKRTSGVHQAYTYIRFLYILILLYIHTILINTVFKENEH